MDLEFALDKKVETDLWNISFKNVIDNYQGNNFRLKYIIDVSLGVARVDGGVARPPHIQIPKTTPWPPHPDTPTPASTPVSTPHPSLLI